MLLAEQYEEVEFWEGRVWKHGFYHTEAQCQGVCLSSPGLTQVITKSFFIELPVLKHFKKSGELLTPLHSKALTIKLLHK
jgi:hypothetical protein